MQQLQPGDRIVRGPNGERGIYRNGQIIPAPTDAAPSVSAPPMRTEVPPMRQVIPPKPPEPKTQFRLMSEPERVANGLPPGQYQVSSEGKIDPVPGTQPDKKPQIDPNVVRQRQSEQARSVLGAITRASENATGWSTGLGGQIFSNFGGTDARTLQGDLDTIKANLAFDRLQQMREESPTGGAVGNVTEMELRLLGSTVASLDQAQDAEDLKARLKIVNDRYADILTRLGYDVAPLDTKVGDVQFKDEQTGVTGKRLSEGQHAEFVRFLQTNPTGADINNWLVANDLGPDSDIDAKVEQARQSGGFSEGVDYSKVDEAARARARAAVEARDAASIGGGPSDVRTLVETGMSLGLTDEAAGVGGAANALLRGNFSGIDDAYVANRDAERMRQEMARENLGWGGTALEVGGGLLSANPQAALAPVTSRLATIGQGARGGAIGGGVAGFGYGEGLEGSATNALLGAGAGAVVGGGISAIASRPRGFAPEIQQEAADTLAAFQRQNVPVNAANIRPGARNALAYLESSPGSAGPIQRNLAEQGRVIEERAATLGRGGTAMDNQAAGQVQRGAGERALDRYGAQAKRYYDAAQRRASEVKIAANEGIQRIRTRIAELSETPETNKARIDALQSILEDLVGPDGSTPQPLSVQGLRELRSGVRTRLQSMGLTATPAEADAMAAINAISDDLARGLEAQSPDAARLYKLGDKIYRERMEIRNDLLNRVLGREGERSSEQIFSRVQAMMSPKGDTGRLTKMWRLLSPDERNDMAATIAENLGRRGAGEDFSPALFVSQARRLSPKARQLVFGREGAQTVEDLARIGQRYVDVTKSLNNSRSGQVSNYRAFFGQMFGIGGVGGSVGGILGGPAGAGAGAATGALVGAGVNAAALAGRNLTARLLLFRPFVNWLGRIPRNASPQAIQAHIRSLGALGREAPVATEINQLHQILRQQFGPAPVSAETEEGNRSQ